MRVLIVGVTGMFGHAAFGVLSRDPRLEAWGTLRATSARRNFAADQQGRLIDGVDVLDERSMVTVLNQVRPDVVINAVGVIKQLASANDPTIVLPINALFPHRLAGLCGLVGARLVHISTDCVFSGRAGHYTEADISDAEDLYGKSKYIGEVHDVPHVITLRTSGIGHELGSAHGLLEWFLAQGGTAKGYRRAIYSGLPWVELARVIGEVVIPRPELHGLYHVSSAPIAKFDLLRLIADAYGKDVTIVPDDTVAIDRSLDSTRFTDATGYVAPAWPVLVARMHDSRS